MKIILIVAAIALATWLAVSMVRNLGNHTGIFIDDPETMIYAPR